MDNENDGPENFEIPENKFIVEGLSTQTNRLNRFASQISRMSSNPLVDNNSGLFGLAVKMKNQFEALSGFQHLLPRISQISIPASALDTLRNTSVAISGLSSMSAIQQIADMYSKQNKIGFKEEVVKSAIIGKSFYDSIKKSEGFGILNAVLGNSSASALAIQSSLIKASALSVFSEKSLTSFPWQDLGAKIAISQSAKRLVVSRFTQLNDSYFNLYKSFEANPAFYAELNPSIINSVPVEYYTGANFIETISADNDYDDIDEEINKNEIIYENEYSLNDFLPRLDMGLLKMWQGSIEAFNSTNTDKVRHFMVSLRELFTHVMHELAPDKEVESWTSDPAYFDRGRPTRKARLQYIYRNISIDPFNKFVDKDVDATLSCIGIFQQGTHSIDNKFTSKQLLAIKSKAESTLNSSVSVVAGAGLPPPKAKFDTEVPVTP